jgi:transcriptional regulator with XRE-family HTH domain
VSHLSEIIATHMANRGLTIEQVARRAGLGTSTVGHFKKGSHGRHPAMATLDKLARGLGPPITVDMLQTAAGLVGAGAPDQRERLLLALFRALPDQAQRHVIEQVRLIAVSGQRTGRYRGTGIPSAPRAGRQSITSAAANPAGAPTWRRSVVTPGDGIGTGSGRFSARPQKALTSVPPGTHCAPNRTTTERGDIT